MALNADGTMGLVDGGDGGRRRDSRAGSVHEDALVGAEAVWWNTGYVFWLHFAQNLDFH